MNTHSCFLGKSVHDQTRIGVHDETRITVHGKAIMGVHDGREYPIKPRQSTHPVMRINNSHIRLVPPEHENSKYCIT